MKTYKYKNVSKEPQTLLGVGEVAPGGTVEATFRIENPNFRLVGEPKQKKEDED